MSACSLPESFTEKMRPVLGEAAIEAVKRAFSTPRGTALRTTGSGEETEKVWSLLESEGISVNRVGWMPTAGWVEASMREKLLTSSVYSTRRIYIQNLASMLPVLVLDPRPGERILDLAAAPGSKTLQIADAVGPGSEIAAVEKVRTRFFKLQANLKAHGAHHVRTFLKDGIGVWRVRPEYFDRVLLDAPCSSEGRFHQDDPESVRYWSPGKSRETVRKQRRLLFSAIHACRPGGTVVYATCAINPDENEGVVSWALDKFDQVLKVDPIEMRVEERMDPILEIHGRLVRREVAGALRILPSHRMEGFFVCRFRKTGTSLSG